MGLDSRNKDDDAWEKFDAYLMLVGNETELLLIILVLEGFHF